MKKTFFTLLGIAICLSGFSNRIIKEPKFTMRNNKELKVTQVELSDTATVLTFQVNFHAKQGFYIHKDNYIRTSDGGKILRNKSAIGYKGKIGDEWIMPDSGVVHFSIIYPPVNAATDKIDFAETDDPNVGGNPWSIYGIELNPHVWKSPLPQKLEGNWLKADGSNLWIAGLYENNAVYNCRAWQYTGIREEGKTFVISLKSGVLTQTLYVTPIGNKLCYIGEKKNTGTSCSLTPSAKQTAMIANDKPFARLFQPNDSATYGGYILHFSPMMANYSASVVIEDVITGHPQTYPVKIESDGTFEVKLPAYYPHEVKLTFMGQRDFVFIEPGKHLFQLLDLEKMDRDGSKEFSAYFMGSDARLNVELKRSGIRDYKYSATLAALFPKIMVQQYVDSVQSDYACESRKLAAYKKSNRLSKKAIQILDSRLEMRRASILMDYNVYAQKAFAATLRNADRNVNRSFSNQKLTDSANNMVSNTLKDSMCIVNNHCLTVIKLIQQVDFSKEKPLQVDMMGDLLSFLATKKEFSSDEKELKTLTDQMRKERTEWKDSIFNNKNYGPIIRNLITKNVADIKEFFISYMNAMFQKNLENFLGKNSPVLSLIKTQQYMRRFDEYETLKDDDLAKIRSEIKNPALANLILEKNNELKATIEGNQRKTGYHINSVPEVANEKLFDAVFSKYKGKVVYVNLWSPWANEIKEIANTSPLKEELANENVVFVYMANNFSGQKVWENKIADIKGEHYRLTNSQWDAISKQIKGNGFSQRILINKKGEIVKNNLPEMSNDELKELLKKELAE